jgi:outer membrane protein
LAWGLLRALRPAHVELDLQRKHWLLVALIGASLPVRVSANDLLEAFRQARAQDPQLQAAAAQRAMTAEAVPQARSEWLPQVQSSGAAGREKVKLADTPASDSKAANYGLTLSQTLWSFESYYGLKEAGLQVEQAGATYAAEEQNLILRVAQAYFGILSAADQLATSQSQRHAFEELLHQAQVREQTGLNARTDVTEAQSFYDATEQAVIDAENALEDAKRALAQITGNYLETVAPLQEDIPLRRPDPDSADAWGAAAREGNLDVRAAILGAQAAQRDVELQRSKYLPSLSAQGSATRTQQSLALGGNEDIGLVQLQINWPLYQGGRVSSLVRQAQAAYQRSAAQLELTRRGSERAARLAFRAVASGVARVEAARRSAESSRQAVEASRMGVEFGTRNEFDLLNSQSNYYTALHAYQQSRYDYLTATLQLKQQAGQLQEAQLTGIDSLLTAPPRLPQR